MSIPNDSSCAKMIERVKQRAELSPEQVMCPSPGAVGESKMRDSTAPKPRRRVSFSDPKTKLRIYPGQDEHWDHVISWLLAIVSFAVRFYRLGIPASVVFDEVRYTLFGSFEREVLTQFAYCCSFISALSLITFSTEKLISTSIHRLGS